MVAIAAFISFFAESVKCQDPVNIQYILAAKGFSLSCQFFALRVLVPLDHEEIIYYLTYVESMHSLLLTCHQLSKVRTEVGVME